MNGNIFKRAFESFKMGFYNIVHKDAAKMLIGMAALGFALSSLGQCFAIKTNDKIDKKKKNFLLMQEAADGVVNIGLFLGITSSVWKFSDHILKLTGIGRMGKSTQPTIINPNGKGHIKSGGRILTTMAASVMACNIVTPLIRNLIAGKLSELKDRKVQKTQLIVNEVIKKQELSPFKNFDNFALSGMPSITFKGQKPYNSYKYQTVGTLKI